MRLKVVKSKNAASFYVQKTVYKDGKQKTLIVEKLGTYASLLDKLNGADPYEWAKNHVDELNRIEKKEKQADIQINLSPIKKIKFGEKRLFNGGFIFLSRLYKALGLSKLCKKISKKYKFKYDLDSILSRLIYSRIIFPCSKLGTFEISKRFIENPNFELQHIYRALDVLEKESDYIKSAVYENSLSINKRDTKVLYYDCTNFYFEMEQESDIRQYGCSKEHRPNPIVQMGLFMDGSGIPLSYCINPGNDNEQTTMEPLEKKILSDFGISKFIVCTDAGLSSEANRKLNSKDERAFITTQPIKKLKSYIKKWCLNSDGWHIDGSGKTYNINEINDEEYKDTVFHKERWIKENGFEQRLIVTYSVKYRNYMRALRENQISRAKKLIETNPAKVKRRSGTDYKRFINGTSYTESGEIAEKTAYTLDYKMADDEAMYDGFYAVCTNIEDETTEIIKINKRRWEIEESFRIMKTEFKSRPVYLSNEQRVRAHFLTCFLALLVFRLLEKKLGEEYTCEQIISALKDYNFLEIRNKGYVPAYEGLEINNKLHDVFGFHNDSEFITYEQMNRVIKN
jgi:transposase